MADRIGEAIGDTAQKIEMGTLHSRGSRILREFGYKIGVSKNPEIRKNYGEAGLDRVNKFFSKDKMVRDVIAVYKDILTLPRIRVAEAEPEYEKPYDKRFTTDKIKVLRIISRLNIGGPALHAYLLTKGLDNDRFENILVTGRKSVHEGDMSYLFDSLDKKPIVINELQRELSFKKDIKAFVRILKIIYKESPDIVHTHTTKAGASARFAVFLYGIFNECPVNLTASGTIGVCQRYNPVNAVQVAFVVDDALIG